MKPRASYHFLRLTAAAVLLGTVFASAQAQTPSARPLSAKTIAQLEAIKADAAARTPVQKKITWSLLYASKEKATKAAPVAGAPMLHSRVVPQADGRVKVRIKAEVTPELLAMIHTQGGEVTSSFPGSRVVYATLPLASLETIAARPDVEFIGLPPAVDFNGGPQASLRQALGAAVQAGTSVNDPEGDVAHGANVVRTNYGATGAGLKVGVLSNSIDNAQSDYESALLNGYVSSVTVVPGQAGANTEDGEGLAMLEIVHRIAPGAALFYATGSSSAEQMAANIGSLAADGCNIIIDDISYSDESPFQEDTISQAVEAASAKGILYFSSAANNGNFDSGMSSCWEGDFAASTQDPGLLDFAAGTANSPQILNNVTSQNQSVSIWLFWADPIGAASSSYFLYELDSGGNVVQEANNQGTAPSQSITGFTPGDYVGVQLNSGSAKFLHIDSPDQQTTLQFATAGRVRGHNACLAANAFSVAATPATTGSSGGPSGPYPNQFTSADQVEQFSNDGPRRVFFLPNGTPITPGNSTSTGGRLYAKPDFAAADGVSTSDGQINPFFGTSAAAPHAGALAALLLSYKPTLTPAQIGAALRAGTVQIASPGAGNRDAGAGILLAANIIQVANTPPSIINFSPANGPVGTIVTITGINLNTATIVAFNGVPATFSIVSSTALTATVPAGATTGLITLQTAGGVTGSPANFTLTTSVSTPVVSSAKADTGMVGRAFAYQITATNGPTAFAAAGLPAGLGVSPGGLISGVPSAPGTFPVTLSVSNAAGGASSSTLTLTILAAPPVVTSASAATGRVGVAFAFQITASNAPTGFSATGLPPGLVLTATNGVISGVPTTPGTFPVSVSAGNAGGAGGATLTITVLPPPPVITSAASVGSQVGVAFGFQITASNSATSFGASGLPPGLVLTATNGVISGVPTTPGTFPVSVSAGNAGGAGGATLTITVLPPPPVIISALGAQDLEGQAFTYTITATNGPTAFAAAGLPPGLTLNPATGLISGTPTAFGEFPITVSAANTGGTGRATLLLTVKAPAVSIKAVVPSVKLGSHEKGEFLLMLSRAQSKPIVVAYKIVGSAVNGQEYVLLSDTKTIKAGKTTKPISIVPKGNFTGTRAVKLILEPRPAYTIGAPHQARVKIIGD